MRIYLEINSDAMGCIMVHKKQAYGTMHRKANKLFACIREGFACACSRKCRCDVYTDLRTVATVQVCSVQ